MRAFNTVILPQLIQLLGYGVVMYFSYGNGSFVGLGALSAIVAVIPVTTAISLVLYFRKPPIGTATLMVVGTLIGLVVPALLLTLRYIEAHP